MAATLLTLYYCFNLSQYVVLLSVRDMGTVLLNSYTGNSQACHSCNVHKGYSTLTNGVCVCV